MQPVRRYIACTEVGSRGTLSTVRKCALSIFLDQRNPLFFRFVRVRLCRQRTHATTVSGPGSMTRVSGSYSCTEWNSVRLYDTAVGKMQAFRRFVCVACVCVAQWYSVVLYELGSHCDSLGCSDPDRTRRSISRQQQRLQPRAWPASSESRSPYKGLLRPVGQVRST
jgi:hypothetical protein